MRRLATLLRSIAAKIDPQPAPVMTVHCDEREVINYVRRAMQHQRRNGVTGW